MKKTLNQKLYGLNNTQSNFYSKDNELEISKRWDKKAKYWDNQLNCYDTHLNQDKEYDNFIKITQKTVSQYKNMDSKLLDIGCGTGLVIEALSSYFNQGIGIDISGNMILEAKKKNLKNVSFYKKSLFDLDINMDGSFDFIVSRGILVSHYGINYLYEILGILFNITKNDGYVIFDFLNTNVEIVNGHLPLNKEYYSKNTIRKYASKIGFSKVDIKGKSNDRVLIGILKK